MTGLLRHARSAFPAARNWSRRRARRLIALGAAVGWIVALTAASGPSASAAALTPAAGLATAAPAATAATAAVPGPPSGWSTVFSDDFNGAAGSAP